MPIYSAGFGNTASLLSPPQENSFQALLKSCFNPVLGISVGWAFCVGPSQGQMCPERVKKAEKGPWQSHAALQLTARSSEGTGTGTAWVYRTEHRDKPSHF